MTRATDPPNGSKDGASFFFARARCPNLEVLHIPYCVALTEDAVAAVVAYCPRLKDLDITGCTSISRTALQRIADDLPDLQVRGRGGPHAP